MREALTARRRRMKEVWLAGDLEPAPILDEIIGLARDSGVAVKLTPRIDSIARTDSHQGVVARGEALPVAIDDELLADPKAFLIALDGVTDPQNLGAIMRSAESAGRHGHPPAPAPDGPRHPGGDQGGGRRDRTSADRPGARHPRPPPAGHGGRRVDRRASTSGAPRTCSTSTSGPAGVLLVLGAEGNGLARLARERCDVIARIPMRGRLASLNVAAAGTLAVLRSGPPSLILS